MLTQAYVQELFDFDQDTGVFTWRTQRGSRSDLVGKRAGYPHWRGYWTIYIDGKSYWGHRVAWLYMYGTFPEGQLDHVNRIRDDNRIANLREATRIQNGGNAKARKSRSGLKGAHWENRYGGKWSSHIQRNGRSVWLGYFATAEKAHAAYCAAAKEQYQEFFCAGIPGRPGS